MYRYLIFVFFLSVLTPAIGQQENYVTVRQINIEGNKKTRDYIILRELSFQVGDTINVTELPRVLERSENNLKNTVLFNNVVVNVFEWDTDLDVIDVRIEVREAWYIYLVPIAELADRNFNVWWNEFNGSLKRVNLGARFTHLNLTGNLDRLKILAQFGFTPKYEIEYAFPYLNKSKTLGASIGFLHSTNKELGYNIGDNLLLFTASDDERVLFRRNRLRSSLVYRPNIYAFHEFQAEFHQNRADALIADTLNRDFFLDSRLEQSFVSLSYQFRYDERDLQIYPMEGLAFELRIEKLGIGIWNDIDMLVVYPSFTKYIRPHPRISLGTSLRGKVSILRDRPPFYQNGGLGYGNDFVRGYELYVVNGQDFFLAKNSAKYRLVETSINLGKWMFIEQFRIMPLRIFFTLNFDAGYANELYYAGGNTFSNRWLYGGGPGIDFILYNNFLFQLELSANHLGEVGLFLHNSVAF